MCMGIYGWSVQAKKLTCRSQNEKIGPDIWNGNIIMLGIFDSNLYWDNGGSDGL